MSAEDDTIVVAISGATASGKSTLASLLADRLADLAPALVKQDWYFRDFAEFPDVERERLVTSNHPRAVLWDALVDHLAELAAGGSVVVPVDGTRFRKRGEDPVTVGPSRIVVVEGHLLFNERRVLDLADLRVFVDANVHERAVRRLLRDTESGSTSLEGAAAWYRRDVIPNVGTYSENTRHLADVIVPFDTGNETGCRAIADWVRRWLSPNT